MKSLLAILICVSCLASARILSAAAQFPERQIPVFVIAKPQKAVFVSGEPILIDVEIKNGLKKEIRLTAWSFSPNDWNGETLCIELPDIYRLPKMVQIWRKRPSVTPPLSISGTGWYPIPAGKSKTKTIDVRKWEIVDGWIAGKYQLLFRADKIDVDSHTWINVTSDPITIEIK
jgi:hypothetical protein